MWDPYAEFESTTLPNGLTVHAAHWPGRSWEVMGFLVHSGAEHDPVGREGLAHFVEHLVSENAHTPKPELGQFFGDCGGRVNFGRTGYSYTSYNFFVPTDRAVLARALSMFGSMLLLAQLEKFIERERQVVIGEFRRHYPTDQDFNLDMRTHKALYAGYWLERFVRPLGNPESVSRITQNELQFYYDTHYSPANMSVVGVGGMQLSELAKLLSESPFGMDKTGVRRPLPTPVADFAPISETRHVFRFSEYFNMSAKVGAYRSFAKIPGVTNDSVVRIVKEMLYRILFKEVREKRAWSYDTRVSTFNFRHFHEISIHCPGLVLVSVDQIEKVVEDCIVSAFDSSTLFEEVKRQTLAGNRMIDLAGGRLLEHALMDLAEYHRIIPMTEINDYLEHVTLDDIRDVLQWFLPDRRYTLLVLP